MTTIDPLPQLIIEPLIRSALAEDLGRAGDVTSQATIPAEASAKVVMAARKPGRIAGLQIAETAFRMLDPSVSVTHWLHDGADADAGAALIEISGSARAILSAERVALNFACHMSGIATATAEMVEAAKPHKARITCTRKTTPGLRAVEKYAVRAGGGVNHRFGLDDGILIKDNHIAIAGGIAEAIKAAQASAGHMLKVEVEVDTLDQLEVALGLGVEAVLLDNMSTEDLTKAVSMTAGRAVLEASGNMTLARVPEVAATGVDIISVGWLTHSTPILDLGLDFVG